jgi:TIR domain
MAEDGKIRDGKTQGRAIFISYRRDDTEGEAGRLFDDLVRAYGDDSVFMDVSGIQPGSDFRKAIDDNVAGCGVLLAVIGPTWATITGSDGARRLDNANDYVRLEIASALARSVPVIPVLVHAAHMPPLDQLPDDLKDLRYRNSVELTHTRWNSDVALLVDALKSYVTVNTAHQIETVHATVPVQLPAPQPAVVVEPAKKSKLPLYGGIGAVVVIAIAVALFAALHHGSSEQPSPSTQTAQASSPAPVPSNPVTPVPAPASPASLSSSGGESAMLGKWVIAQPIKTDGDDLRQMAISDFGGQIMASAAGKCPNELCRWGERKATLTNGSIVTETWDLRNTPFEKAHNRSVTLSIAPNAQGIEVTVHNHWQQPDGSAQDSFIPVQMRKAG